MPRAVALPRAINLGPRNRVPMAVLRSALVEAGDADVVTLGQSGNIVLTSPLTDPAAIGDHVARVIEQCAGVSVPCVARSAEEMRRIAALDPLRDVATDGSRLLVVFFSEPPPPAAVAEVMSEDHRPQVLHVEGSEAYVWTPDGVKKMTLSFATLEKRFGIVGTARNANTVHKIVAAL